VWFVVPSNLYYHNIIMTDLSATESFSGYVILKSNYAQNQELRLSCGPRKWGACKRSEYIDRNNNVAIFTHLSLRDTLSK